MRPSLKLAASIVALLAGLLAVGAAHAVTSQAERHRLRISTSMPVTGYQEEGSPVTLIARNAAGLSSVGVDGTLLAPAGAAVEPTDPRALAQLRAAHRSGLPATLLVSNFSNATDDFSEPLAHRLLSDPPAIAADARALARTVRTQHWQGITVDFESLTHRDESGLTDFVRGLSEDLPRGSTLDVDIMNSTTAGQYPATGYDLSALGHAATGLVLMAYDDHGPWENTPGAIGPLAWERAGLTVMLRSVPATKLILGVAGYGYAWEPHANVQLSDAQARAMTAAAGVRPRFDARAGEWTATLGDGTVIWWSDARSLGLRIALARRLHLAGVAVWDLQLSDPIGAPARQG